MAVTAWVAFSCRALRARFLILALDSFSVVLPMALVAFCGTPAEAYIANDRWTRTATNGTSVGTNGTAITLTWSIAPDGTTIPGVTTTTVASDLVEFFDDVYDFTGGGTDYTARPWFTYFDQAFARISALSGVTYVYEPNDDGNDFSSSSLSTARGVLGVRGDVRIGARTYGGDSSVLASNFFPDYGEMMFNSDRVSYFSVFSSNHRRLQNTLMHEAMHGLGISHVDSDNAAFLIEPNLQTGFYGPQLDDLHAIQRLYGDRYEKSGGNNTSSIATALGTLGPTQPIAIGTLGSSTVISSSAVDFVSISGTSDTDYFSFSVNSTTNVNLQLTPRGTTYMVGPQDGTQTDFNTLTLNNLELRLYGSNGTTLLQSASGNPAGVAETIQRQLTPGTYYARVLGAQNQVQFYGLDFTAAPESQRNLLWVGNGSSTWATGGAANFIQEGFGATNFLADDHVRFDDTSSVKTVTVSGSVAPKTMRVTTATSYTFSGSGGIVTDSLTVDGAGIVHLANTGNSDYGDVQVNAGTLRVTGLASSFETKIGNGALLIESGGDFEQLGSYVGFASGSNGTATVTGAGSTWTNDFFFVGNNGSGTLAVSSGGLVLSNVASVGYRGTGGATISGTPSTFTSTDVLFVGDHATGTMTVQSGGTLNTKTTNIGGYAGSNGTITVVGAGSTWNNSGSVFVGGIFTASGNMGTLNVNSSGSVTIANTLKTYNLGSVSLTSGKLKTSTLDIAQGSFSQTGGQLVATTVTGNLTRAGGSLTPGDTNLAGLTSITGNYTQQSGTTLEIELGGTSNSQFDRLSISGTATLAGTLTVSLINSFVPSFGNTFQIMTFGNSSGAFDIQNLPTLTNSDLEWLINSAATSLTLSVGLMGDFNGDGIVDAADYIVWRKTGGTQQQYEVWQTHFGAIGNAGGQSASSIAAQTAVPEPSVLVLALVGGALCATRWRKGVRTI